jgi:DNA polymerase elongation subunit (family B)
MLYEKLQIKLLKLLQKNWNRVISLDIETHLSSPNHFLKDERILCISLARRISGNFIEGNGIETRTLFLQKEDDDSEKELLRNLDTVLLKIRPLGVIGYGLRQYDIPLLVMKKQHYNLLLWKLIDMTESAVHIDLYHLLKYKGYKKLDQALLSPEFAHLPLSCTRNVVPTDRLEKGKEIFRLWKESREDLKKYTEGEVHDCLLIAEELAFRKAK